MEVGKLLRLGVLQLLVMLLSKVRVELRLRGGRRQGRPRRLVGREERKGRRGGCRLGLAARVGAAGKERWRAKDVGAGAGLGRHARSRIDAQGQMRRGGWAGRA